MVEGLRLAREALEAGAVPRLVLYDPETLTSSSLGREMLERIRPLEHTFPVSTGVIVAASETRSPAGLVMVFGFPDRVSPTQMGTQPLLPVLDGISDPGNAGTILRTAWAAGLTQVAFAGDAVDPFSGKVVRAGMGAHFHLDILPTSWAALHSHLASFDQVVGAETRSRATIYDLDWNLRTALVIGSEAHGLSPEAKRSVTVSAQVPMSRGVESLNAATVAAIILFHARHERLTGARDAETRISGDETDPGG